MSNFNCEDSVQSIPLRVDFNGYGSMSLSNISLDYCPLCNLGTTFCGDGIRQYPNADGLLENCDGSDLNSLTCLDQESSSGAYGGGTLACTSECDFDTSDCCVVEHGAWGDWEDGICSASIGVGTQEDTRDCNNPEPACGGEFCLGESTRTISCCVPGTCVSAGYDCGSHSDSCGGSIDCGACGGTNTSCDTDIGMCACNSGLADCDGDGNCNCNLATSICNGTSCCALGWSDCDGDGICECNSSCSGGICI